MAAVGDERKPPISLDAADDREVIGAGGDAHRGERDRLTLRADVGLRDLREAVEQHDVAAVGILREHDQPLIRVNRVRALRVDRPELLHPRRPALDRGQFIVEDVRESRCRRLRAFVILDLKAAQIGKGAVTCEWTVTVGEDLDGLLSQARGGVVEIERTADGTPRATMVK